MATIVTRAGKGSPLTHNEVDANFVNLNNDKAETAAPTFTGQISIPDGTAAAPSLTNTGDTNTGLFFPAEDTVAVSTAATERMRIDASGNVGIGGASSGPKLAVTAAANSSSLVLTDATQSTLFIKHEATNLLTYETGGAAVQRWVLNGAERMRIDASGNVGIGTSSPTPLGTGITTLELKGNSASQTDRAGGISFMRYDGNPGMYIYHADDASYISSPSTYPLLFQTNGTERARIDASGGLSLASGTGVTTTADNDGTFSSGTYTPTPVGGNMKIITNSGAFTFAAPSATGDYTLVVLVMNSATAGAVTLSGFNRTVGDAFTTTNGQEFLVNITKINGHILANVVAMQ